MSALHLYLRHDLLEEAVASQGERATVGGVVFFDGPEGHLDLAALVDEAWARGPARGRPARLSEVGEALLLDRVAAEAGGALAGLRGATAAPGLLRSLRRIFQAAAVAGISPPLFERAARRLGGPERILELARLYGRYRGLLGARMSDQALAFRRGAAVLGKSPPPGFFDADGLDVHGLWLLPAAATAPTWHGWFTACVALATGQPDPMPGEGPGRNAGPDGLPAGARRPPVRLVLPAVEDRPVLEAALAPLLAALYRHHDSNLEEVRVPLHIPQQGATADPNDPWHRLIESLFAPGKSLGPDELSPARLSFRPAPTPAAEARAVARAVRDLLDAGAAPATVAVVAQDPARRVRIGQALRRYGVPIHAPPALLAQSVDRQASAGLAPPVQVILGLYGLRDQGVPREALIQYLSTRYVRFPSAPPGRSGGREGDANGGDAPPWRVARALREAGVRDLNPADRLLRAPAQRPVASGEANLDYRRRLGEWSRQQRQGSGAGAVLGAVETILSHLADLPDSAPVSVHAAALLRLCERLRLAELCVDHGPSSGPAGLTQGDSLALSSWDIALPRSGVLSGLDEDGALSRDQEAVAILLEVLAELPRQHDRLFAAAAGGKDPMPRERFARLLSCVLGATLLRPRGAAGAAVLLGDLHAACARRPAHLLVAGLVEGELPGYPQEDSLLGDDERRGLNRLLGRDVFPLAQGETAITPLLFAQVLSRSGAAHLFWPLADGDSRPLLRSSLVDELLRAAAHQEPPRPCEEQAVVPPAGEARCAAELWTRAALDGCAVPSLILSRADGDPRTRRQRGRALLDALSQRDPPRAARLSALITVERERARWFAARLAQDGDGDGVARSGTGPGPFTGRLIAGDLRQALSVKLPGSPNHPLSASALEDYAKCPFRFFVRRVLKATPMQEAGDDLDPLAGGRLHHEVLQHFFEERQAKGQLPLRGGQDDLEALDRTIADTVERWPDKERMGHRDLFAVRIRRLRDDLRRLVLREAAQPVEQGCVPRLFEHEFGPLSITSPSEHDGALPLSIKGIIDRVDIDARDGRALVLDYKAGRLDRYEAILRHELLDTSFQLPLYAAALLADENLPRMGIAVQHVTAGYYSLRQGRPSQGRLDDQQMISLDPRVQAKAPEHNVAEVAYRLWRRLRDGDFRVDPKSCEGCGLEAACRVSLVPPPDEPLQDAIFPIGKPPGSSASYPPGWLSAESSQVLGGDAEGGQDHHGDDRSARETAREAAREADR